jgi:hypothetical protein
VQFDCTRDNGHAVLDVSRLVGERLSTESVTDLATVLAALGECDLHALHAAIDGSPNFAPGLLAWLEHAVGWEIDRRAGVVYPLLGPHAAIDDPEIDRSLVALAVLAACFREDGRADSVPVADFLKLTATVLSAEVQRPDRLQ